VSRQLSLIVQAMTRLNDDDWALLIGHCMMEFSRMEQDINILWMRWNNDTRNPEGYKSVEVDARAKAVIKFVQARVMELGSKNSTTLINNLNILIYAFQLRHLIAHNPVGIEVYEDAPDEAEYRLRDVIIGMRDKSKSISYDKLSAVLVNLKELRIIMGYNSLHAMGLLFVGGESQTTPDQIVLKRFNKGSSAFEF
jgi:hypothetical protein